MNNMRFFASLIIASTLICTSALAADVAVKDPAQEIVYRTNLGRAADVNLLIKKGVSPNQVDEKGTPLIALAANRKDKEAMNVVKALIEAGADVNGRDAQGQTALFYAVRQGNIEMIRFLLDKGISYYAPDNGGNIARTLAFQQNRQDIVDLLDQFVTDQTAKVNKQYEDYNRQIEERNKLIEEQNKAAVEEAAKAAKAAAEAAAAPKTADDEYLETLAPKENTPANPAQKRESPQFEMDMRNFAFQNCAFQYWSFCRQVKQRSNLSPEEMRVAIDTHREQVLELMKKIKADYQMPPEDVDEISKNVMQRTNDDLEDTESNTYRFEHGVCLMPDLQTRCTDIAETWAVKPLDKSDKPYGAKSVSKDLPKSAIGGVGTDKKR